MSYVSERVGIDINLSADLSSIRLWALKQTFGQALQNDVATALIDIVKANPSITLVACQSTAETAVNAFLANAAAKLPMPESAIAEIVLSTTEPTLDDLVKESIAVGYIKVIQDVNGVVPGDAILAAQGITVPANLTAVGPVMTADAHSAPSNAPAYEVPLPIATAPDSEAAPLGGDIETQESAVDSVTEELNTPA